MGRPYPLGDEDGQPNVVRQLLLVLQSAEGQTMRDETELDTFRYAARWGQMQVVRYLP